MSFGFYGFRPFVRSAFKISAFGPFGILEIKTNVTLLLVLHNNKIFLFIQEYLKTIILFYHFNKTDGSLICKTFIKLTINKIHSIIGLSLYYFSYINVCYFVLICVNTTAHKYIHGLVSYLPVFVLFNCLIS